MDVKCSPSSPQLTCMSSRPSAEEAGRYLETYKAYEQKPADLLMEKLEQDFVSRVRPPPCPGTAPPQRVPACSSFSSDLVISTPQSHPQLPVSSLPPKEQLEGSS